MTSCFVKWVHHLVKRGGCFLLLAVALVPHEIMAQTATLSEALNMALADNPLLNAAGYQKIAAEMGIREIRSGYFPQISLGAGYTAHQEPHIVVPIHEVGVFPPLDDRIYETSFHLKMPLFNGGRTAANTRVSQAHFREVNAQETMARMSLMEGVGRIFIQASQVADHRDLIAAHLRSLAQRYREMALLLKEGRISPGDLELIAASIESARADSIEIEMQKLELAYRLGAMLGRQSPVYPVGLLPDTTGGNAFLIPGNGDVDGPLVLAAQAQQQRAEAFKGLANSQFWPEISAWGNYSFRSGSDLDMIGEWAAGIALRMPLFEGGRRMAGRKAAQASLLAAEESVKAAQQEQKANLEIAREHWHSVRLRRGHIERAVSGKSKSVAAQRELYQAGRVALSHLMVQEAELLRMGMQEKALAYAEQLAVLSYFATAGSLTAEKVETIAGSLP